MTELTWQRSSYCEAGSTCIHVATAATGTIHFRESETPETILTTTPDKLRPLISRIKSDTLTRSQG
ncbi:DUF397 domain-containing protein [Streptomyces sp. HU2014]|uniref:DUF397 domain-containing protein n=1 Tax=Streptomyces sp. HU2014 TaxID=2939414 RepID=UPI00200F72F5|nr:DUF397 domain-containing protein [Streptomyces sp. HU2014]UQI43743.1 DUF397 domain-containing protein [Streptomyces sp. HU2014]